MPVPSYPPFPPELELPARVEPAVPGDLKSEMAATGRALLDVGRGYLRVNLWLLAMVGWSAGQGWREIRRAGRLLRDPKTSRQTAAGTVRALVRGGVLYGAALVLALPLRGVTGGLWTAAVTVTVVSLAAEVIWAGQWFGGAFKPDQVDLVKKPPPVNIGTCSPQREETP